MILESAYMDKASEIVRKYKEDKFLVFVHSKNTGDKIKKELEDNGIQCEIHNADLQKEKRHKVESDFKSGNLMNFIFYRCTK